ncbi:hypothetical protein [Haloarcula marina]|uniref:hypothetical protein n=1 Tax=Haloarcula marina TaxID=2961574 RepID=UPI0020B754ED|nr:hypothetical protein [Halomicroarcula marina]
MNQLESAGVLLIGIGVISGSVATTQSFSKAVLPSVFIIAMGVAMALVGRSK